MDLPLGKQRINQPSRIIDVENLLYPWGSRFGVEGNHCEAAAETPGFPGGLVSHLGSTGIIGGTSQLVPAEKGALRIPHSRFADCETLRRTAKKRGGLLLYPRAALLCGQQKRASADGGRAACESANAGWRCLRVTVQHLDPLRRDLENLGNDLRIGCLSPLPLGAGASGGTNHAVCLQLDPRAFPALARGLEIAAKTDADEISLSATLNNSFTKRCITCRLRELGQDRA